MAGRSVQVNTIYDDLTNVKGALVRKYGIRDILNRSTITKGKQKRPTIKREASIITTIIGELFNHLYKHYETMHY